MSAEPLTPAEIADIALINDNDRLRPWGTIGQDTIDRLLATITAQRQEIERLKGIERGFSGEVDKLVVREAAQSRELETLRAALRELMWKGWSEPLEQLVADEGRGAPMDDWRGCIDCGSPEGSQMHLSGCRIAALLSPADPSLLPPVEQT